MRFDIGDRVILRSTRATWEANKRGSVVNVSDAMHCLVGRLGTVVYKVRLDYQLGNYYSVAADNDGGTWSWHEGDLEPICPVDVAVPGIGTITLTPRKPT